MQWSLSQLRTFAQLVAMIERAGRTNIPGPFESRSVRVKQLSTVYGFTKILVKVSHDQLCVWPKNEAQPEIFIIHYVDNYIGYLLQ